MSGRSNRAILTRKHFIDLADHLRTTPIEYSHAQLEDLADWLRTTNTLFDRTRWIEYVTGKGGPHGGTVRR